MNMHVRPPLRLAEQPGLHAVKVGEVRHWNDHLFSFCAARPATFRFRSGEFVMIGLPGDERPVLRAYSIASAAYADTLSFLSVNVPGGPLTSRLQRIRPEDEIYLGKKPTGTLVTDALIPGQRLFLLATGTGLAPFLSIARDPEVYDMFAQIAVAHGVRRVSDLAHRDELEAKFALDPLVADQAFLQFQYVPTVTREAFASMGRIPDLIEDGRLFAKLVGPRRLDPETDRVMLCGSPAMIADLSARLEGLGFDKGSNARPGRYVVERAFAG